MASSITGCKGKQVQMQSLPWFFCTFMTAGARAPQLGDSFHRNMTITCAVADSRQEFGGAGGPEGHAAAARWHIHAVQGALLSRNCTCITADRANSCREQIWSMRVFVSAIYTIWWAWRSHNIQLLLHSSTDSQREPCRCV